MAYQPEITARVTQEAIDALKGIPPTTLDCTFRPQHVSMASVLIAYPFVTGNTLDGNCETAKIARALVAEGHGQLLSACASREVVACYAYPTFDMAKVARAILSVNLKMGVYTLVARYASHGVTAVHK